MKKLFFLAMMAVVTATAMAQVNPKPGYVITHEQDTLWGEVDLRIDEYNMKKCSFRQAGHNEWVTYTPEQIDGYRFADSGKMYVSKFLTIKGERKLYFAEFMVKGTINLYYIPIGDRYFFQNEDGRMAEYIYEFDDMKSSNSLDAEREKNIQDLVGLMKDSPSALKKISKYKMYREDLIKVAQAYHNDMCKSNDDCIVYSYNPKTDKTKLHYRVFAGGLYTPIYKLNDIKGSTSSYFVPAFGAGIDIDLPKVAKGLAAQVQITYCMKANMSGMLNETNDREFEYEASTNHLLVDIGAMYSLTNNNDICPVLRAGIVADMVNEELHCVVKSPTRNSMIFGGYAGVGVIVPVGKLAITLEVTGRYIPASKSKAMIMATAGIRL